MIACVGLSPQLFAVAQDPEFAKVAGLNVRLYNLLVSVMAAVTVTVAMRTVGLLLVSALMVVPVATAQQLTRASGPPSALAMALGTAGLARRRGRLGVRRREAAPGATIVLLALACFVAGLARRASGCVAGAGCGAVPRAADDRSRTTSTAETIPTSTAPTAATPPSRTGTTSTTSTTATATRARSHYDEH